MPRAVTEMSDRGIGRLSERNKRDPQPDRWCVLRFPSGRRADPSGELRRRVRPCPTYPSPPSRPDVAILVSSATPLLPRRRSEQAHAGVARRLPVPASSAVALSRDDALAVTRGRAQDLRRPRPRSAHATVPGSNDVSYRGTVFRRPGRRSRRRLFPSFGAISASPNSTRNAMDGLSSENGRSTSPLIRRRASATAGS